jgi:hypothetical protein
VPDECQADLMPTILTEPASQTVFAGKSVSFHVEATGIGTVYQWRRNGVPLTDGGRISGATTATLEINRTLLADNGGSYDVVVTAACAVTSAPAILTVNWRLGDLNCDGHVDFDDINAFVLALVSHAQYVARYPDCRWENADCNRDGYVDFDDINPFVACLVAGDCP